VIGVSDSTRANATAMRNGFIVSTFQYGLPVRLPVGVRFFRARDY
jgi:hypothetical protein